ncbi:MAG: MG2 domain-containing protein [Candidatus Sumerlaeota bacterium]|nr:MG2 domain-containing protein [Candidatus Sumerlaeota bacterium]
MFNRMPCCAYLTVFSALLFFPLHAFTQPASAKPSAARPARNTPTEKAETPSGFRVKVFTPGGAALLDDTITVEFTAPVSGSQTRESTATVENLISFSPSLAGTSEWESPSKFRFKPRGNLKSCTHYIARVNALLRDLNGRAFEGPVEFSFSTPALTLLKAEQTGFTSDRRALIQLTFSDAVSPADLKKHLFLNEAGTTLKWKPESGSVSARSIVITDPPLTEAVSIRLEPGLRGASGPLGLEGAVDRQVKLTFRLYPQKLQAQWVHDKAHLVISFSNPVRLDQIKQYITIDPPLDFDVTDSGQNLLLSGDFKAGARYTVSLKKGLRGSNGQLLLQDTTLAAWVPPMRAFLEMVDAGGHLSPKGSMRMRIRSASLPLIRLRAWRVYDNNLVYNALQGESRWEVTKLSQLAASREIPVTPSQDGAASSTNVDLRELLGAGASGLFFIRAEGAPPQGADQIGNDDDYYDGSSRLEDSALIAVSNLGIVGKTSDRDLTVWVGALDTAKPVAGARVRAFSARNQMLKEGQTGADGLAMFPGIADSAGSKAAAVIVNSGDDVCFLDLRESLSGAEEMQSHGRDYLRKGYEAFVSAERGAYRPSETAHIFGFVRGRDAAMPSAAFPLEIQIERPDDKMLEPIPLKPGNPGIFAFDYRIPAYSPLGLYHAHIQLAGTTKRFEQEKKYESYGVDDPNELSVYARMEQDKLGVGEFYVEEFIPNRLKVEASAPEGRVAAGKPLEISLKASEMFGQPSSGRVVDYVTIFRPEPFAPKQYNDYTFGDATKKFDPIENEGGEATTGNDGRVSFTIEIPDAHPPAALLARIQVTVKEAGGRGVTAAIERTIDPVPFYIGVKQRAETYVVAGKEAQFDIIGVRPDDNLVSDTTQLTASVSRVRYNSILKREGSSFRYETNREATVMKSAEITWNGGRASFAWTPPAPGAYQFLAADPATNAATSLEFYASSPQWDDQPWSLEKPECLELVLDKKSYTPGSQARLLVKSPFTGTLLLSFEQDRVLTATIVEMTENTKEVAVPVTDEFLPNVYIVGTMVRPVKPAEKWLPHRAFGMVNLKADYSARSLSIDISAPVEVRPNSNLTVSAIVKDTATSAPVPGDIILWAVDEGVLTLTDFKTPDPLAYFYAPRQLMVATSDFFSQLMPDLLAVGAKSSPGGGDEGANKRLSPVSAERVRPVSLWMGVMKTDSNGSATASFHVPQFTGRLRVMAATGAGQRFGSAEATVFARSPLMIQDSLPRFFAPGDNAAVPFIIYNNTNTEQKADLLIETSGTVVIKDAAHTTANSATNTSKKLEGIVIPAHGSSIQYVEMTAAMQAGVCRVTFSGKMGTETFMDYVDVPVRPASPLITLSGYDSIAPLAQKSIDVPSANYLPGATSSTLLVSGLPAVQFAGGLDYVLHYPYGCLEQTVSSLFPLLYFSDLAAQMAPGRFGGGAATAMVQAGIDRALSMQTAGGGMAMWSSERDAWPWGSVYAAHMLVEAGKAGYEIPESRMRDLLGYLAGRLSGQLEKPEADSRTERCYICYVLAIAGKKPLDRMEQLYEERKKLTPSARALLAGAFMVMGNSAEARELLGGTVSSGTTPAAAAQTAREPGGILSSPVRETAILLASWLDINPDAAEVPVLVRRLEQSQQAGHWGTTQDNAFALWALGRYAKRQAAASGTAEGTVGIGGAPVIAYSSSKPLSVSADIIGKTISVNSNGAAPTYIYWTTEGVPLEPDLAPVSQGIAVSRRFTSRDGKELNLDAIEQGKLVIVEIAIQCDRQISNLVIQDLLPAGLEIENPNLASSEKADDQTERTDKKDGLDVRRTESRDDRCVAFADIIKNDTGKHIFKYAARAVTRGVFILPPVQVSCMYDPDIMARSAPGRITISAK